MSEEAKESEPRLRLEYIDPAALAANPANWRTHPERQTSALRDVIAEVGWAGALLYNERTGRLIDGHARKELYEGQPVPVLIGSWDEATEKKILATLDPLADLAESNTAALDDLLRDVQTGSEAVASMLEELAKQNGILPEEKESKLKPLDVKPPPVMTWVLVGVPTVQYGAIAELVEKIAAVPSTIVETTANDG